MTCIVGIEDKGVVYIGGDSAGVAGLNITVRSDEKVFINGPLVMGFTTSFRMGQILRYALRVPDHDPRLDDMEWLVVDLIDAVRSCFSSKGYLTKKGEVESGGVFLLGYKGKLYQVESDFQVGRSIAGYDAVGCGSQYANGTLHYLMKNKPDMPPEEKVKHALDAASYHSAGVIEPYVVLQHL